MMNERDHRDEPDPRLDAAIEALRATAIPPEPAELATNLLASIQNHHPARTNDALAGRWKWSRRAAWGSLAVAILVVAIPIFHEERAIGFEQAIDNIRKASAVRLKIHADYGHGVVDTNTVTIRGEQLRIDGLFRENISWVFDRTAKVALIIHPRTKRFQHLDLRQGVVVPLEIFDQNVRDELLNLKNQQVVRVGTETIAGETAERYTIPGARAFHLIGDWEIWSGRSTGLPVKARFTTDLGGQIMTREYDSFEWNPELDATTFDTEPPAGYRRGIIFSLAGGAVRIVTDPPN